MNHDSTSSHQKSWDIAFWRHLVIGFGLLALTCILDVARPFDRSWSILYVVVAIYAGSFLRGRGEIILLSGTLFATFAVPTIFDWDTMRNGTGLFYRATGVAASFVLVGLMWDRRRVVLALQLANVELEKKVDVRTSELQVANQFLRQEVADRQQSEITIRKISGFREAVIRTAAEGICVYSVIPEEPFIKFSVWNEQMTVITGYTMNEINRLGWYPTLYPDLEIRGKARDRMGRLHREDDMRFEEWEILRRDGKCRTVAISTSVIESDDETDSVVAVIQDVTERKLAVSALHESEMRFRLLFEGAGDAIFWANADTGRITHCNKAAEILLSRDRNEIIGQMQTFVHPPEDAERYRKIFQAHVATKAKEYVEAEVIRKDGRRVIVSISPSVTTIGNQKIIQGVFRDITESKQAEESLQMMRSCVDRVRENIFWVGRHGRILYANDAACSDHGYSREDLLGMTVFDLDAEPNPRPELWEQHFDELKKLGMITLETRHRSKDGRVFPIEVRANYVQIGDKELNFAFCRNITERKQRQNRIAQLAAIVESSNDAIISTDLNGMITSWNRGAVGVFAYRENEILGRSIATLISSDRVGEVEQVLKEISQNRHIENFESDAIGKDGRRIDVSLTISPVWDSDGKLIGSSTIVRDITERKWAEAERHKLQAQILHAQKLESLGILAGGIAHDFNNLLTSVTGYASLAMLELPAESPVRPMIREIENAAQRAADLTSQMLAYSGKCQVVIQPVRLDSLVEEMLRLLKTVVSKKANLVVELEPATIQGDATQIRQVVMNIITNASDSLGGQTGNIRIKTGVGNFDSSTLLSPFVPEELPSGVYSFVEVQDDGCGINVEMLEKIFDPFFTTKFTGRGLGLAAVLGIVRAHKGTIKLESAPDQGTCFQVLFPCSSDCVAVENVSDHLDLPRGRGKILVIDDDPHVRSFTQHLLEKVGFQVITADDGREGLDIFGSQSKEIDAVLLDLTMPRMDGLEVFRDLRSQAPEIPILVMSGYSEQEVSTRCTMIGADEFFQKPFNPRDLIDRISNLMKANVG